MNELTEIKIHLESLDKISIELFFLNFAFKETGNDYMSLKIKDFQKKITAIEKSIYNLVDKSIDEILRNTEQADKNMINGVCEGIESEKRENENGK